MTVVSLPLPTTPRIVLDDLPEWTEDSKLSPEPDVVVRSCDEPPLSGLDFVCGLPPELVISIFEFLPVRDCIRASHASRTWRSFIVARAPSAWSALSGYDLPAGALTQLLTRSATCDLKLKLQATRSNWEEVAACLRAHLSRCSYLKLRIKSHLSLEAADTVTTALCGPAPRMRRFKLIDNRSKFNHERVHEERTSLFAGGESRLRHVKLCSDISAFGTCTAFKNVTKLVYATPKDTSAQDLSTILSLLQNLESLGLDLDDWTERWHYSEDTTRPRSVQLNVPSRLVHLVLFSTEKADVDARPVLALFPHSRMRTVHSRYRHPPSREQAQEVLNSLVPASSESVTCLSVYPSGRDDSMNMIFSWRSTTDEVKERCLTRVPLGVLPSHDVFAGITSLTLGESAFPTWDQSTPYPALPALTDLTLLTLEADEYPLLGHHSVFLLPRARDPARVFLCPRLAHVWVRAAAKPITYIAPDVLREFIEYHMAYDAPRLEYLRLIGVKLLENIPEEVASLAELADEFSVLEAIPWCAWGVEDVMDWY